MQAEEQPDNAIQFKSGHSGATIEGTIKGRAYELYTVQASAGQRMTVEMQTDNAANYFNIFAPGKGPGDAARFIGSTHGNRFSQVLPSSGVYTIQAYLMPSAARRDETANFSLDISLTAGTPATPTTGDVQWPLEYDTAGKLTCAVGDAEFSLACPFRVRRHRPEATIWTISPADPSVLRILYFRKNRFSTNGAAKVQWQRQGDNWRVDIGEQESYLVPDAVIQGD
ncbi:MULTISPECIES: hypothetical protein [Microbulbifer]|uniref:hypothetical protein n=1 Tax=Microbulbifer TaxID=48073 RepID=UPI001E48DA11|nr:MULTISPECIES: hypothetical protein [Microbulbifer]UHQ55216.1 hypothetical protein LVE68_17160 [Microbulbifer sp. YPW16]